jgi:hypothetical protein
MEKISGGFLLILLGVIWLGPPMYWGYINGNFLAILVWPLILAFTAVSTGWRYRKRSLLKSLLHGIVFAAIGVVPIYFFGLLFPQFPLGFGLFG